MTPHIPYFIKNWEMRVLFSKYFVRFIKKWPNFKVSMIYRALQKSCYTFNFEQDRLKLNIIKTFVRINNCHCNTNTYYIYK